MKSFWKTLACGLNSQSNALSLLLVVFDCHPPSKIATNSSHTSAIKLPCKNTLALLLFSLIITVVLDPAQLDLFLIAVFICISTLRMVIKKNRVNRMYN